MRNPFPLQTPKRVLVGFALGVALVILGAMAFVSIRNRKSRETSPTAVLEHWAEVSRARRYLRQGRPDLAFQAVSGVRDEGPGAGEAMNIAGQVLLQYREFRGARMALERALRLQPNQIDAIKALATINLMLGNGVRGVELLQEAVRLDPKDARVWLTMGKVSHDLGDPARAAQAFEQAVTLNPKDREAMVGLVSDLLNSNRSEDAGPWLAKGLEAFPDDSTLLGLAARQARDAGRTDESMALATRALTRDPDNLNALLVRSRTRLASGHPDQALADLEHAVATHPSDVGSLQLLAQVESRLGLTDRARASGERHRKASERAVLMDNLTQQIASHPDDPEPRWRMGQTAAEGGALQLAGQCYQAALALDPNYQPARDGLEALRSSHTEAADPSAAKPAPTSIRPPRTAH